MRNTDEVIFSSCMVKGLRKNKH